MKYLLCARPSLHWGFQDKNKTGCPQGAYLHSPKEIRLFNKPGKEMHIQSNWLLGRSTNNWRGGVVRKDLMGRSPLGFKKWNWGEKEQQPMQKEASER